MDWLRLMYWIFIVCVWIELAVVWWLIWRNTRRAKELKRLEELYETAIRELDSIRDRYIERLDQMREVSDEGSDNDNGC